MLIRPIRHHDIDEVLDLGAAMHEESAYRLLPYHRRKVRRLAEVYTSGHEAYCGLVAEEEEKIIAMFGGYVTDYFFCDERIACDMVLFVDRRFRGGTAAFRLIRAFRRWAETRKVREICLSISTEVNTERTGRLYERLGLLRVGAIYKQRLY
ncbi:MAG: GNAT family N-acetyltransferase [Pseudomonadota bacterium]